MELLELQNLLLKPDDLVKTVINGKVANATDDELKQYYPVNHAVVNTGKRPDKLITTDQGPSTVLVARLPIPMQKRIVRLAAAFLCGNPIELLANAEEPMEQNLLDVLKRTWKDNKLDYKSKKLAKFMMAETEVAELWYVEPSEQGDWKGTVNDKPEVKTKLRMKILAPSLGDKLYPVFNAAGDMIAFARLFNTTIEGTKTDCIDLYTVDTFYHFMKATTGWVPRLATAFDGTQKAEEPNLIKKIPVIYYSQEKPEWYDVQEMIDRYEKLISNHADTNDYHMSPTIKVRGKITGFSKKGESGKILELEDNAEAEYMSWDKSPESLKLEMDNLKNMIHDLTSTPNISFENVKGLGQFSGVALKMLFQDAHMKAADHEENFGESIQRRINFLKVAMAVVNKDFIDVVTMEIEPKFTYYVPKNDLETVEMLTAAVSGKILSTETATNLNPLVQDAETEKERLAAEANSAGSLDILNQ